MSVVERGPHDFCVECGTWLNLRDSYWGNCFEHREAQRQRISRSLRAITELLESGRPLGGKPKEDE